MIFIINELIVRDDVLPGIYNVSDDESLSTNEIISLIAHSQNKKKKVWKISKKIINFIAFFGDKFNLSFNSNILKKTTSSLIVDNKKILKAIGKPLPHSCRDGLIITFKSFSTQ